MKKKANNDIFFSQSMAREIWWNARQVMGNENQTGKTNIWKNKEQKKGKMKLTDLATEQNKHKQKQCKEK